MPSPEIQSRSELRPLTSVRGIAAWFVVLYHIRLSAAQTLGPDLVAIFAKGYLAVDFFFMLSGFVIWLNYADRLRKDGLTGMPRFLWRRLARIYPLHLFMLCGAILFVCAHIALGKTIPLEFPIRELPLHVLLVQNWGFTDHLTWNSPAWSISCEFAAYLLFPLLAVSVDWRRWPTILLVGSAGALVLILFTTMRSAGATYLVTDVTHFGLVRCLTQFCIGTIVCALWTRWRDKPRLPATLASLCGTAAFIAFLSGTLEAISIPIAFACLLLALALTAEHPRHPLGGNAVHYLGEISYATYLVHYLLFVGFKLVFVSDPHDVTIVQLTIFLLLTLAASSILHRFIERPSQRWLNRRIKRTQSASTNAISASVN